MLIKRTHIMQAVGKLDQNYPRIIGKCKQYFFEILCLLRCVDINNIGDFGKSINDPCDLISKFPFYIFQGNIGIFNCIMQKEQMVERTPRPISSTQILATAMG